MANRVDTSGIRATPRNITQQIRDVVFRTPDETSGLDAMMDAELAPIDGSPRQRKRALFGLALSGGGIRSATFNLGLLQGLQDLGLLGAFDYLSTVSGGGYIGGFWSAWRARADRASAFPVDPPPDAQKPGKVEAPEVRHLREFGNFLAPQFGTTSYDTGRVIAAAVSASIPSLLMTFAAIVLVLLVWLALMRGVAAPLAPVTVAEVRFGVAVLPRLIILLALGVALYEPERRWRSREGRIHGEGKKRVRRDNMYLLLSLLALWLTVAGWTVAQYLSRSFGYYPDARIIEAAKVPAHWGIYQSAVQSAIHVFPWTQQFFAVFDPHGFVLHAHYLGIGELLGMLEPAIALLIGTLGIVLLRAWRSQSLGIPRPGKKPIPERQERLSRRAAYDRVIARMLFLAMLWAVPALTWAAGLKFYERSYNTLGVGSAAGALSVFFAFLFSRVQRMIVQQPSRPTLDKFTDRLRPLAPKILAYATLAAMVIVCEFIILDFFAHDRLALISTIAFGITLIALVFVDPNTVGMHEFYRGRIARAFLGASNDAHRKAEFDRTEEHAVDDISLRALRTSPAQRREAERPVHLLCCAANDIAQYGRLHNLRRGADSGVLSSVGYSVGYQWRPWEETEDVPTLAAAMTASGAAFNSLMGGRSMELGSAVTFLMTALNLRLGMWYRHPAYLRKKTLSIFDISTPGKAFYDEMIGNCNSNATRVHLSDGGHFENMGVYELIRRQCQFILVSDCGMDPQVAFDDLANLVRRVREDFGVEIRVDVSPLKPNPETGLARQPMVAGDIHYRDGSNGVLLLIKPSITGNEPTDIAQYRKRNAQFPHETTLDQFYDEAQWESYRRLGRHTIHTAFPTALLPSRPERGEFIRMFGKLRVEWLPAPANFDDSERYLKNRSAALDGRLNEQCDVLRREVYPETISATPRPSKTVNSESELARSFSVMQEATLLLEEIYYQRQFEISYNHPQNLGWVNYAGRWAHAPLFTMYWPLLRARASDSFARFMERQFSLPSLDLSTMKTSTEAKMDDGFAKRALIEQHGPDRAGNKEVLQYLVHLHHPRHGEKVVQAALLMYQTTNSHVYWDAEDLFIPAGLWGIGLDDDFLRLTLSAGGAFQRLTAVVRISLPDGSTVTQRKESVDRVQLYRSAGFREAFVISGNVVSDVGVPIPVPSELRHEASKYSWLVR